jgi:small subunit ribosomal protein S16
MAVKIRLRRVGAKKRPRYRVVIAEARTPRDGKFIETIGHYNPQAEPAEFVVKADRVQHWMQNGAKPTETVERLLRRSGLIATEAPAAEASAETVESEE